MRERSRSEEVRKKRAREIARALKRLFPTTRTALRYQTPWQLVVATILSAQCTDKKVNEVTEKLFKKYRKLEDYVAADPEEFAKDIRPTGFYRNKAKHILAAARVVQEKYKGKVPKTMEELLTLPGVARKTANVILGNAFGVTEGIPVDTHVRRLARRLGLTDEESPEKIEQDLMQLLPRREWFGFAHRLIDYGRTYCPARPHDHEHCPLTVLLRKKGLL
ncbi:endonuclease III [Candidatus Parcubacteria bacterium]|nr:MAG: endonuclease III [Candidatus Parcubacteria bacterium]